MKHASTMPSLLRATNPTTESTSDVQEHIRRRAYELYEQRGRNDGHDLNDWLQAELEMTQQTFEYHGRLEPNIRVGLTAKPLHPQFTSMRSNGAAQSDAMAKSSSPRSIAYECPISTAIAAGPSLAPAATIDSRSGNTLHSLPRIFRAELALHKRPQTNERRGQPLLRQQSPLGWRVRTQPIARSSPRRSPHTSDSAGSGRNPPLPIAAAEPSGPVCRVPSTRSPRPSAGQPQIPGPTEVQPAIANAPCPPFPRGIQATAAAARTTRRGTPRLPPARLSPLAIEPRAQPLELSQTLLPSWALPLRLLSHYSAIPAT